MLIAFGQDGKYGRYNPRFLFELLVAHPVIYDKNNKAETVSMYENLEL